MDKIEIEASLIYDKTKETILKIKKFINLHQLVASRNKEMLTEDRFIISEIERVIVPIAEGYFMFIDPEQHAVGTDMVLYESMSALTKKFIEFIELIDSRINQFLSHFPGSQNKAMAGLLDFKNRIGELKEEWIMIHAKRCHVRMQMSRLEEDDRRNVKAKESLITLNRLAGIHKLVVDIQVYIGATQSGDYSAEKPMVNAWERVNGIFDSIIEHWKARHVNS